ncbi:hypothetical protein [Microbacterium panaciterrae]|uniref:Uncharacterized protein n=1 Tax=Microbacterium panaciterrae TaxID=985759 RepID=A0ABP8PBM6_9MICO
MEQEPIRGQSPLDPPDARVARAYLDVLPGVQHRAERVLDLRRLGRLYIIEGIAIAAYIGVYFLAWGVRLHDPDRPPAPLNALAVFLIWSVLAGGVRERYGARRVLRGARRGVHYGLMVGGLVLLLALMLIGTFSAAFAWHWLLLPSLLFLAAGLWAGMCLQREARNDPPRAAPAHLPFTRTARVGTIGVGAAVAVSVALSGTAVLAGWGSAVSSFGMAGVMILFLIALLTGRLSDLGETWRAAQWSMFGFGAMSVAATALLVSVHAEIALAMGIVLGVVTLIAAVVVSLLPERDDD